MMSLQQCFKIGVTRRSLALGPSLRNSAAKYNWSLDIQRHCYSTRKGSDGGQSKSMGVPDRAEHLIVGGGIIGMSTAYWLRQMDPSRDVAVIERDPSYQSCSTVQSVGGLRSQFSLPENIRQSLFTAQFFKSLKENLSVADKCDADIQFQPCSYMFLASDDGAETLRKNHATQIANKAQVALLDRDQLKLKCPWLNVEDVTLGTCGMENEGYFDPHLLLTAVKAKCLDMGVKIIHGKVTGFCTNDVEVPSVKAGTTPDKVIEHCVIETPDGGERKIEAQHFYNCAGAKAGHVGRLMGIGTGDDALSVSIPVEPRKRYVYVIHCPDAPGREVPFLVDHSGVYVRPEGQGGNYLCGASPPEEWGEPDISNLDVDYSFFDEYIWPRLAHRVPAFECVKG